MSGALTPLPPGRQREIAVHEVLADLAPLLEQLRDALPLVNDEAQRPRIDRLRAFAATATLVLDRRSDGIDQSLIDDIANLLGNLRQLRLPARDPDMGFTLGLREVNGAQGQIAMVMMDTIAAAAKMGLRPSEPDIARLDAAEVPKALLAGQVAALAARMDNVLAELDRLQTANAPTQIGLVNFYLGEMRVETNLAMLSLSIGDTTIDFSSLIRAVEAMVRLTGDFLATLRGWAERVSASIQTAAEGLLHPVRRVARGVRASVGWLAHKFQQARQRSEAEPPPDFSMDAVRELILAGKEIPSVWVPLVTELVLLSSGLTDATPLAGLTALQYLDLSGTQVSDATPLAGLTALEELDLTGTRVTDVSPLRQPKLKIRAGPGGLVRAASAIRRRLFNPKP